MGMGPVISMLAVVSQWIVFSMQRESTLRPSRVSAEMGRASGHLSRRKLKLPSHKLDAVCRYCGIPLDHHHAGSDAIAAARILIYLQGESQGGE